MNFSFFDLHQMSLSSAACLGELREPGFPIIDSLEPDPPVTGSSSMKLPKIPRDESAL